MYFIYHKMLRFLIAILNVYKFEFAIFLALFNNDKVTCSYDNYFAINQQHLEGKFSQTNVVQNTPNSRLAIDAPIL